MSRHERQRAFAVAVLVVAAAVAALSAIGPSKDEGRAPPPSESQPSIAAPPPSAPARPSVLVGTGEVEDQGSAQATADAGADVARRAAARYARRFIAVFARYQAGRLDRAAEQRLRALAAPQLAAYLLARPPRGARRFHARVRIERLDLAGPESGRVKAAALLAYGDRRRSLFELALERAGRRWRVTELYPSGG
jgi:hypothetical protein